MHDVTGSSMPAPDQAARDRIHSDLRSTLFVDAGAGSGKTAALVDRVVALIVEESVDLSRVAAITFTEKAGDELRDRIRRRLETVADDDGDLLAGDRCRKALEQLDGAAIGTLHAFAQRLLSEFPVEAGLPPRVEVLDEVTSEVAFDQRWSLFQDRLLEDGELERTLLLFFGSGVSSRALRALAQRFEDNWDLVERHVPQQAPDPPPVRDLFAQAVAGIAEMCSTPCSDPSDRLRARLDEIAEHVQRLCALDDELDLLEALDPDAEPRPPSFRVGGLGRKASWDDVEAVRARVAECGQRLSGVRDQAANACAERVGSVIRGFTIEAAHQRRIAGQLQFHDLLVLARALLCHPEHGATVRTRLHERYRYLLLDEFQDTDPIQIELAVRIAAGDPEGDASGADPWAEVEVQPGRLFFVGDPKQSIYRFRGADIATFLAADERFGRGGRGRVELTANFRTVAPVIEWINHTFANLFALPDEVELPVPSQADYLPLQPTRQPAEVGPSVAILGRAAHPAGRAADELREAEAEEVAATVCRVVAEGWLVDDGAGGWRAACLGDVTILVPARTSLPFLEDALEEVGIPFRTESSSLVYATRAVRDLLMVLRAVDDPTNQLHLVSALRTPLLACGDDDLFRFRRLRSGRWSYLTDQPDTVPTDDPVRAGLDYLRSLYDERHWLTPSALLDRIATDRRALELGFGQGRPRDVWRRLRFVIDQARAWSDATGGNLRQYLSWVGRQAAEGTRATEAILPESDDDAVRIMTVHAAKGLEFPVTIVSGMSTRPTVKRAPAEVVFHPSGAVGYRLGSKVVTQAYMEWMPIDEQMSLHERIRLLYVAGTRARDHLVVSLHRAERANDPRASARTNAELLVLGMGDDLATLPDGAGSAEPLRSGVPEVPTTAPPFDVWYRERAAALEAASRPGAVAATALTDEGALDVEAEPDPGLDKRPRDLDLPPWLKGRYGTAVGRAVHGVLQSVDLTSGDGIDALVAAQCEAEAVPERADDVQRLARVALDSPSVREAAASTHWREIYVSTPVAGRLLEGYVDLLYRSPAGLVVVDYKTAATSDPEELDRRVEHYRNQGASYATTVAAATGQAVARVTFLFLTPTGAVERDLPDLDGAIQHVRDLVASGREVLSP